MLANALTITSTVLIYRMYGRNVSPGIAVNKTDYIYPFDYYFFSDGRKSLEPVIQPFVGKLLDNHKQR